MREKFLALARSYRKGLKNPWPVLLCLSIASGLLISISVIFSQSRVFGVISYISFIVYLLGIIIIQPDFIIKYLAFLFSVGITTLGIAACEFFDLWLVEIESQSMFVGSIPLLMLGQWTFILTLVVIEYLFCVKRVRGGDKTYQLKSDYTRVLVNLFSIGVAVIYTVVLIAIIDKPAFAMGVDRFGYAKLVTDNTFIERLAPILPTLLVIPSLCFSKGCRAISLYALVVYCLFAVWSGQKFGAIFTALCFFLLVNHELFKGLIYKYPLRCMGALGVLLLLMVGFAALYMTTTAGSAGDYLLTRTSQQGQLWWKTYQLTDGETHVDEFPAEVEAALEGEKSISESVGADNGIYKIMYLCAPEDLVDKKLLSGSRYTDAGYACAYYYFGTCGVLGYGLASAILVGTLVNLVVVAARNSRILLLVLFGRFYNISRTSYLMFTFGDFFDLASKATYLIILLRFTTVRAVNRVGLRATKLGKMIDKFFESR